MRWSIAALIVALGVVGPRVDRAVAQEGVIQLEDTEIKGRIQKPEAFYILKNADLDYQTLDKKPSFLEELIETVEEEPF